MKKYLTYFTKIEITLWLTSVCTIVIFYAIFDGKSPMTIIASLIGVTSLIFLAKGNPFGNVLMIIFSVLYTIISYTFSYYGEMITYSGMTAPMALFSLISWLRNPYKGNKSQVKVRPLSAGIFVSGIALTIAVTITFTFILSALNTTNLIPSSLSVATSFFAAYLTFMRTPYFPLAYALNDIVLIVMWCMAIREDISYISVIVCFCVFLANDLYGFVNWYRMKKTQGNV